MPDSSQIVGVYSSPPVVHFQGQLAQARAVAISTGLSGETVGDAEIIDAGTVWSYELCGFGSSCKIGDGKASLARGRLLQREALELSLYTFKYEKTVDYVLTYFPPATGGTPAALFLRRNDLKPSLEHPLADTLPPPKTRLAVGELGRLDLLALGRYVRRAYTYSSDTLQDGSPLLVLSPATA